ncbi:hypothetical protein F3X89_22020 [Rhizobium rhizogenes]|uniref:hypothetical protein n=1 Tax=Rhizobium rhizogenes TaxID=359 RepID=UPI00193D3FD7|nr:hypothetical protein [Rhizobium rhizogenes]QRM40501.1 hypothetical protein F3X89_22020 [Rhizobium rhizogenes]
MMENSARLFIVNPDLCHHQSGCKPGEKFATKPQELLKVLEHPDIPLHTNASENDIRSFVTRRY